MPDPAKIFALAERVDLEPELLAELGFRREVREVLLSINGQFTKRAAERGLDGDEARTWFDGLETLVSLAETQQVTFGQAADLAVRLYGLSFIISEQVAQLDGDDLLTTAAPSVEA